MVTGIIGKKLGMTQIFREDGTAEVVTAVEAGPCTVIQVKTADKEGYNAVQFGFGEAKRLKSPSSAANVIAVTSRTPRIAISPRTRGASDHESNDSAISRSNWATRSSASRIAWW